MWGTVCDCVSEEKGKAGGIGGEGRDGGRRDEMIYKDGRREIYNYSMCRQQILEGGVVYCCLVSPPDPPESGMRIWYSERHFFSHGPGPTAYK